MLLPPFHPAFAEATGGRPAFAKSTERIWNRWAPEAVGGIPIKSNPIAKYSFGAVFEGAVRMFVPFLAILQAYKYQMDELGTILFILQLWNLAVFLSPKNHALHWGNGLLLSALNIFYFTLAHLVIHESSTNLIYFIAIALVHFVFDYWGSVLNRRVKSQDPAFDPIREHMKTAKRVLWIDNVPEAMGGGDGIGGEVSRGAEILGGLLDEGYDITVASRRPTLYEEPVHVRKIEGESFLDHFSLDKYDVVYYAGID